MRHRPEEAADPPASPRDPIAAVTHPDPYPYYARLVAEKPVHHDDALGLWVAASAEAVHAALTSDLCRVRPPAEPVPKALLGSSAGEVFRHLVRMNDGPGHCPWKQAVTGALEAIDGPRAAAESQRWARCLAGEIGPPGDPRPMAEFAFRLPGYVMAALLGVPRDMLQPATVWLDDFVRCLAPAGSAGQIDRGAAAAGRLRELLGSLLDHPPAHPASAAEGLLAALAREARRLGRADQEVIIANGIGFLSQSYEATAGLIGNTLVALGAHPGVLAAVRAEPGLLRTVVWEVLRFDPPVQNTRRFLARSGVVAGQEMREDDAILVVLAAANRDPAVHPHPERFDVAREERRMFTLGAGAHACPGEALAATIAVAGVEQLLLRGIDPVPLAAAVNYRASANLRIPLFS
jgi:cytochrome P450